MSIRTEYAADGGDWTCGRCAAPLEQSRVQVVYLGNAFEITLPRCPVCGQTLVPKSLAQGKMAEVEALLEDK